MTTPKAIRLPLPNTEEWIAQRYPDNPSPGWYFLNRVLKQTTRDPPQGLLPLNIDTNDYYQVAVFLDERARKELLSIELTPLVSIEIFNSSKRKRDLEARAKQYSQRYSISTFGSNDIPSASLSSTSTTNVTALPSASSSSSSSGVRLCPSFGLTDQHFFGPGTSTYESADIGPVQDKLQHTIAEVIAASSPLAQVVTSTTNNNNSSSSSSSTVSFLSPYTSNPNLNREWLLLVRDSLMKTDALYETDTLQRLTVASESLTSTLGTQNAIMHLLIARSKYTEAYTTLFTNILTQFRASNHNSKGTNDPKEHPSNNLLSSSTHSSSVMGPSSVGSSSSSSSSSSGSVPILSSSSSLSSSQATASATGSTIVCSRIVNLFQSRYLPILGEQLLRNDPNKWMKVIHGICEEYQWRKIVTDLAERNSNQHINDPLLEIIINIIAESKYKADVSGSAILAADVSYAQQLTIDTITKMTQSLTIDTNINNDLPTIINPVLQSELSSLLTTNALQTTIQELTHQTLASTNSSSSSSPTTAMVPSVAHAQALRLSRMRQELGYSILVNHIGALSSSLSALPGDPFAILFGMASTNGETNEDGTPVMPALSVYEAGLKVRQFSLSFFQGKQGRQEFFPDEESFVTHHGDNNHSLASAVNTISSTPVKTNESGLSATGSILGGSDDHGGAGEDSEAKEIYERAKNALCSFSLNAKDVKAIIDNLQILKDFMYDSSVVNTYITQRNSMLDIVEAGEDVDGSYIREACIIDHVLLAYAFVARLLRQPDVLVLLLHLLFHPNIVLDESNNNSSNGTETVALAFGWGLTCASNVQDIHTHTALLGTFPDQSRNDNNFLAINNNADMKIEPLSTNGTESSSSTLPNSSFSAYYPVLGITDTVLPKTMLSVPIEESRLVTVGSTGTNTSSSTSLSSSSSASNTSLSTVDTVTASSSSSSFSSVSELQALRILSKHAIEISVTLKKPNGKYASLIETALQQNNTITGAKEMEALTREEALITIKGLSHPSLALGVFHYLRQVLIQPGIFDKPRVLRLFPIYIKMGLLFVQEYPLLVPSLLGLLRQGLQLSPTFVEANAMRPLRENIMDTLVDMLFSTGYILPTLEFILQNVNVLEIPLIRRFLSKFILGIYVTDSNTAPPSLSLDTATILMKIMATFLARLVTLHERTGETLESIVTNDVRDLAKITIKDCVRHVSRNGDNLNPKQVLLKNTIGQVEATVIKFKRDWV